MECVVNPCKGLANSPYAIITDLHWKLPENRIYRLSDNCFWWQDQETGWTDFFFHCPASQLIRVGDNHYQTPKSEGYGGRIFTIQVEGFGKVDLRGPWSGGCYCANPYLPKLAIEVTVRSIDSPGLPSIDRTSENRSWAILENVGLICVSCVN
jgi:hypothetical protein